MLGLRRKAYRVRIRVFRGLRVSELGGPRARVEHAAALGVRLRGDPWGYRPSQQGPFKGAKSRVKKGSP